MSPRATLLLVTVGTLGCNKTNAGGAPLPVPTDTTRATVSAISRGQVAEGRIVSVNGSCLGVSSPRAPGAPPRTRSDWILADDSAAVYVVGALPTGCAPLGGPPVAATVVARVALDTVGARVRAFLIRPK